MQCNVYVIDDDLVSQFATRYCIEQYDKDFAISTCKDAEEALERLASLLEEGEDLPDLIFLDLVMGDMNGWQFLDHLKKLAKGKKLPQIYILSAFLNSKDRIIAKEHTMIAGYIHKPLSRNILDKIFKNQKDEYEVLYCLGCSFGLG